MSCTKLSIADHDMLTLQVNAELSATADTACIQAQAVTPTPSDPTPSPLPPGTLYCQTVDAIQSHTAESIIAGNPMTPHLDLLLSHSLTPMSMSDHNPLALAELLATDTLQPWWPPLYEVELSVFSLLNFFHHSWFLS
jgi:hypothetical protein